MDLALKEHTFDRLSHVINDSKGIAFLLLLFFEGNLKRSVECLTHLAGLEALVNIACNAPNTVVLGDGHEEGIIKLGLASALFDILVEVLVGR